MAYCELGEARILKRMSDSFMPARKKKPTFSEVPGTFKRTGSVQSPNKSRIGGMAYAVDPAIKWAQ